MKRFKAVNLSNFSISQLHQMQSAVDTFVFKETGMERWESSFTKDPEQFDKLVNQMVSYKTDVMRYFRKQFDNRWNLINQYVVKADEVDEYLFYAYQWGLDDQELATILEKNNNKGFDFGVLALTIAIARGIIDYSSLDASKVITKNALQTAKGINETTRKRIAKQIETANALGENRSQFDLRLKRIFNNNVRGSMISENQTLTAYFEGKTGLAMNLDLQTKTWLGAQARDFICGNTNGETVPVDQPFSNGLMGPLAHIGCRCDVEYN